MRDAHVRPSDIPLPSPFCTRVHAYMQDAYGNMVPTLRVPSALIARLTPDGASVKLTQPAPGLWQASLSFPSVRRNTSLGALATTPATLQLLLKGRALGSVGLVLAPHPPARRGSQAMQRALKAVVVPVAPSGARRQAAWPKTMAGSATLYLAAVAYNDPALADAGG